METSSDAPIRQDVPAQPRRTGSRHVREIFESLPLSTQFRMTAIAAVTVTLLAVQLVTALWDTWSARAEAVSFARRATTSMAQRLEDTGGGALDDLRDHPEFLAAALQLQSGAVLQQYVRGQEGSYGGNGTSAILDHALLRPSGWPYRFQSALAFTPIFVDRPVQLSPTVSGTVRVVVDHTWIWSHATRRLEQAPVALLLGCLVALLAANLLQRQVVEPLAELAMATRTTTGPAPQGRGRSNELRQLASNFEGLANQLVDYERDLRTLRHTSGLANHRAHPRTRGTPAAR